MNDTKWEELLIAMCNLGDLRPRWRTKDLSGHLSPWDGDWFYHFRNGGYESIEWVEIHTSPVEQDAAVFALIRKIHLPGHRVEQGFRIYGHAQEGVYLDYV